MKKFRSGICAAMVMAIALAGLAACAKKEGPAEHAGKELDKAVESAGQKLEKAGQDIQDAAKDTKK